MQITLINDSVIEGNFKKFNKDNIYIEKNDILFIIHVDIISMIVLNGKIVDKNIIKKKAGSRINYNRYDKFIEINKTNIDDEELYESVKSLGIDTERINKKPSLSPKNKINKHHYLATKPIRFIVNWVDLTYGYRFINKSTEIRTSISYIKNYPYFTTTGPFFIIAELEVLTYATSVRKFFKDNSRGFYFGAGLGGALIRMHDVTSFFLLIPSETDDGSPVIIAGPLFELGYTGYLCDKIYSSFNLGLLLGISRDENNTGSGEYILGVLPIASYSLGFVF